MPVTGAATPAPPVSIVDALPEAVRLRRRSASAAAITSGVATVGAGLGGAGIDGAKILLMLLPQ